METIIAIFFLALVSAVLATPLIWIFRLTKSLKHYRVIWRILVVAEIVGAAFFVVSFLSLDNGPSGPSGPFGNAPIQLLWLLGFLATLFALIYAFIWGSPKKKDITP
jgi:hypothetical protein